MDYKFRLEGSEEFYDPSAINDEVVDTTKDNLSEEGALENVADGNSVIEQKEEVTLPASEEVIKNTEELNEEKVSEFLKNNPDLLNKLKPSQEVELDEDVKKFLEFKKETGRSYSDFIEYQRDPSDFEEEEYDLSGIGLEGFFLSLEQYNNYLWSEDGFSFSFQDYEEFKKGGKVK